MLFWLWAILILFNVNHSSWYYVIKVIDSLSFVTLYFCLWLVFPHQSHSFAFLSRFTIIGYMDLISKYDLIEKIVQTTDETILWQVKHLLDEGEADSWEDFDPRLKASLERGLAQADNNEVIPHNKVMAQIKKKYPKKQKIK